MRSVKVASVAVLFNASAQDTSVAIARCKQDEATRLP